MGAFEGVRSHFAKNQSEIEELIEAKSQSWYNMENEKL